MPQHFDRESYWLFFGVFAVSCVIGYMVGASNSPVVGAAIPSLFGLVAIGIGALRSGSHRATSRSKEPNSDEHQESSQLLSWPAHQVPLLGILLTIFSVGYMVALLVGTTVRANSVKSEFRRAQFPWARQKTPENVEQALDWLVVQQRLIGYGYSYEQVQQLYILPRANTPPDQLANFLPPPGQNIQTSPAGTYPESVPEAHSTVFMPHPGVPVIGIVRDDKKGAQPLPFFVPNSGAREP